MNLPAAAARKIPLDEVKEILGLPEGRLERLIHDGALPCEEGGIDSNVLNAAIRKQDAIRRQLANAPAPWQTPANPHVAPLPTGDMGVIELAPGRVTLWGVQPQGRLPGVDYEKPIRETIRSAARNDELAAIVEATIWREMGDPAQLRLDELRDLAETLATSWTALSIRFTPFDWRDRRDCERQTPGLFLRPRQALEAALTLPERLGWTISRSGKQLLTDWQSQSIMTKLNFWADRIPGFNPRADGVSNGLAGASIDLFDKAMAEIRSSAGLFYDGFIDTVGRATC